jgi:nucleoside-diphosphate-sugar epimerase
MGNLLEPGRWQDEAAADWVFHLPLHDWSAARVTRKRLATMERARVRMDAHLLDAVSAGATRRIVYVADTSWYGATGPRPITEDEPLQPSAWGNCLAPALDRLDGRRRRLLPIVSAFPGWVYGNASWFRSRVIEPVTAGRRSAAARQDQPMGVADSCRRLCPRWHLAGHGETGGRYFLVNDDAVRMMTSRPRSPGSRSGPARVARAWAARLLVGPILADYLQADGVFSNIRLHGIGFRFRYPTLERGFQQILTELDGRPQYSSGQ